jgi:carbonic anhydrase
MKTITQDMQKSITPLKAVELLKAGNERFLQNLRYNRNLLQQVNETADNQFPFASILSCIDSRTPAELIFDQGLGDIFSVRIAGNVVNEDILGSLEFTCKLAGSKLIMVLGHTNCGAIKGACDHAELGHLTGLLNKIKPAIDKESTHTNERNGANIDYVNEVARLNVELNMASILERSAVLKELVDSGEVGLAGGLYDLETGKVTFLG